jgi:alpha-L-fucosidase 2
MKSNTSAMLKQLIYSASLIIVLLLSGCNTESADADVVLWYDEPAVDWYEALPIGNGTLGAMVYSGVEKETLQLNENTLYSGEPGLRHVEMDVTRSLEKVKKLIAQEKLAEAQDVIKAEWLGRANDCYQPFGHIYIEFDHDRDFTNYRRELNIQNAILKTEYQVGEVSYQREVFASNPDNVIVMEAAANRKGSISCRIKLEGAHPTASSHVENNTLVMKGQAPAFALWKRIEQIQGWGQQWMYPELFDENGEVIPGRDRVMYGDLLDGKGTFYEGRVGVKLTGGTLEVEGDQLVIKNADKIELVLSGDTSYDGFDKSPSKEGVDPSVVARANLKNALDKGFDKLKEDHVRDYQELFNRVEFSIGEMTAQSRKTTDERIALFNNGEDISFAALFMQYNRYLTIASSREGGQPINLQGVWNKDIIPPWSGSYTMNINAQIYYWMTEAANLEECVEPLFRLTKELSVNGAKHAREAFGLDGWAAHHNTAIWRQAQPVEKWNCSFWPFSAAWLCQHIMTHYQFTNDKVFLEEYWPVMKGAAQFLSGWLIQTPEGYYTTPVGSSPENRFYAPLNREEVAFCQGPTMDIMLVKELFTNCITSAEILGIDDPLLVTLEEQVGNLQPYKIGSQGQLLEWDKEYDEIYPDHRHISHLYGLCPGNEITRDKTPELFEAVKRSMEIRGDEGTGWAMAWKSVCWARLKDGNHAYKVLNNLFKPGDYDESGLIPNLLSSGPPFNIDGNFGGGAAIIEMLLQSHETKNVDGEEMPLIEILPALPDAWEKGHISGLRARNGFEIDIKWEQGKLVYATVQSLHGKNAILRYLGQDITLDLQKGESYRFSI